MAGLVFVDVDDDAADLLVANDSVQSSLPQQHDGTFEESAIFLDRFER